MWNIYDQAAITFHINTGFLVKMTSLIISTIHYAVLADMKNHPFTTTCRTLALVLRYCMYFTVESYLCVQNGFVLVG